MSLHQHHSISDVSNWASYTCSSFSEVEISLLLLQQRSVDKRGQGVDKGVPSVSLDLVAVCGRRIIRSNISWSRALRRVLIWRRSCRKSRTSRFAMYCLAPASIATVTGPGNGPGNSTRPRYALQSRFKMLGKGCSSRWDSSVRWRFGALTVISSISMLNALSCCGSFRCSCVSGGTLRRRTHYSSQVCVDLLRILLGPDEAASRVYYMWRFLPFLAIIGATYNYVDL